MTFSLSSPSLEEMTLEQKARELIFKKSLDEFCDLLSRNHIRFLIFKGAALAYDFYQDPVQRPRTDTDLFISENDIEELRDILLKEGYDWIPNQMGLLGQTVFTKKTGALHMVFDVHWQLFAPYSLRNIFTFEELWSSRRKISQLEAFTVSDLHAIVISSVHWVAHHLHSPEPQWVEDTQKLSLHRDTLWWETLKQICQKKGLQKMMDQTLILSQVPSPWQREELSSVREPFDYLLEAKRSAWTDLRWDLKFMGTLEIFYFLCGHLFPSLTYMRAKYKFKNEVFLPIYYFWRLSSGFKKFLKPW